jgi:hypothetical protein
MIHDMIVQLPITGHWGTDEEMDLRHQLEEEFQQELGGLGSVDGGDIGSGNMNVFIYRIPEFPPALERVKAVLTRHALLDKAVIERSTFQNEGDDEPSEEVVVWPENYTGVFRLF